MKILVYQKIIAGGLQNSSGFSAVVDIRIFLGRLAFLLGLVSVFCGNCERPM